VTRGSAIVLAGLLACAAFASADETSPDPRIQLVSAPEVIGDFELTDHAGRSFRFSSLRGREALVFFGFTHCPDVCPAAMLEMKLLQESMRKSGQRAPLAVFVSVDGERDTPEALKRYLAFYPDTFIGLTGDPKLVRKIAAQFKAVFFKGLPYDNAGNYQVEHTSMIYLVDSDGRLRASFLDAPLESMAATIAQSRSRAP
jgi:protein SCO1/2